MISQSNINYGQFTNINPLLAQSLLVNLYLMHLNNILVFSSMIFLVLLTQFKIF